jgi:hypothetical protein
MKKYLLVTICVFTHSTLSGNQPAVAGAPVCRIFIVRFQDMYPFALSAKRVAANPDREILIKKPQSDLCVIDWNAIKGNRFSFLDEPHRDIRAVFLCDGKTYGFNSSGEVGVVDDRSVSYSSEVSSWFKRYLKPLNGGD